MTGKCYCGDCQFFSEHKFSDLMYGKINDEEFKNSDGICLCPNTLKKYLVNYDTIACNNFKEE